MKVMLSITGVMMLFASVVAGAGVLIAPVRASMASHSLSEPAGLLLLGVGCVLVANEVRRKKV